MGLWNFIKNKVSGKIKQLKCKHDWEVYLSGNLWGGDTLQCKKCWAICQTKGRDGI